MEKVDQKSYWVNTASQKWIQEYDSIKFRLKEVTGHFFEFLPKGLTTTNNKTASLLRRGISGYTDRTDYE